MRFVLQPVGLPFRVKLRQRYPVLAKTLLKLFQQCLQVDGAVAHHGLQALQVEQGRVGGAGALGERLYPGQALAQRFEAYRLEQAVIHAGLLALPADFRLRIGGVTQQGAAWPLLCVFVSAYRLGKLITIDTWHVAVDDQHIECLPPPYLQSLQAIVDTAVLQPQVIQLLGQ
ncbi:hypothetical protein D3C80_686710 [compost metagenome]